MGEVLNGLTKPRCGDCKYYEIDPKNITMGICHANPPLVQVLSMNGSMMVQSNFPPVKGEMWCGEFMRKINA